MKFAASLGLLFTVVASVLADQGAEDRHYFGGSYYRSYYDVNRVVSEIFGSTLGQADLQGLSYTFYNPIYEAAKAFKNFALNYLGNTANFQQESLTASLDELAGMVGCDVTETEGSQFVQFSIVQDLRALNCFYNQIGGQVRTGLQQLNDLYRNGRISYRTNTDVRHYISGRCSSISSGTQNIFRYFRYGPSYFSSALNRYGGDLQTALANLKNILDRIQAAANPTTQAATTQAATTQAATTQSATTQAATTQAATTQAATTQAATTQAATTQAATTQAATTQAATTQAATTQAATTQAATTQAATTQAATTQAATTQAATTQAATTQAATTQAAVTQCPTGTATLPVGFDQASISSTATTVDVTFASVTQTIACPTDGPVTVGGFPFGVSVTVSLDANGSLVVTGSGSTNSVTIAA